MLVVASASLLKNGGILSVYGPFIHGGVYSGPTDEEFDAKLKSMNPSFGYMDVNEVISIAQESGNLKLVKVFDMPANNKMLTFAKQSRDGAL